VTESWGLDRPLPVPERTEWTFVYVPFEHGIVAFIAPTLAQEHLTIAQELTAALSLGYIRYLDFQQLEEQNKTLEENLRLLRETQNQLVLQEKMASLGKLVAGVVHEMNTPMGAIRSSNDTLMRAVARMKEKLETVVSDEDASMRSVFKVVADANRAMTTGVERVGQIVHSLRDFVRLDEAEHVMADPRVGMESTLTLLQPQLEGITVGRQFESIEPLYCSPGRLNQVYMILLTNALDALRDDGEIGIRIFEADGHVCVRVRDNGAGIPPERLESIFEFGFSTSGPRVKMSAGLATAYAIVQEHGGDIKIESEVDVGTTVTIRLPRRTAA
jgi:signal transduction histidine kinase